MKIGIVGTGSIAREALPQLKNCGWEIAAMCSTPKSENIMKELCSIHHVPAGYVDYPVMLTEANIDTVYVAVPNFLHYSFVKQALESGKNVIVEKPMASNDRESEELSAIAKSKNLYLFEAITTLYLSGYNKIKELLPCIGTIKVVSCNFSQYSRRYDMFRRGTILPAFDPQKSGGALMDLNLYNLHWLLGLFGPPKTVHYYANMEHGIDTSGILILEYDLFQAVSIAAKDCASPGNCIIQGTKGYIQQNSSSNICTDIKLHLKDGTEESYTDAPISRLEPEFRFFANEITSGDRTGCYERLEQSLLVSRIQTKARLDAGIRFPADKQSDN